MRNKIILKIIFFFSFLMCLSFLKAQEVLYPLNGNPVIKQYLNAHPAKSNVTFRIQSADDTFSLAANHPFVDDFSRQGIYPYDSLWSDSAAFINTTFCDQPVTIGVATLDGIDKYGVPYDSLNGATDTADFLTSKPIHLFYPGDTTIWLSFYYQPQGLGDEPEPTDSLPYQQGDSLTLQFLDSSGNWIEVWSVDGHVDTAFQRVNIRITGGAYLYDGFRFRFMNYATRNGNRDHWNLDYVWLNRNRHENDPIPDVALATIQQSLIKEYQSMPYPHYKSLSASQLNGFLKDSLVDLVIDIGYGVTNISFGNLITDESGTVLNTFTSGNLSLTSNTTISTTVQLNQPSLATAFQGYPGKSAEFLVRDFLNWGSQTLIFNDTNYYTQKFHNYYAYDDGSAEWAYGIPEAHAKIAYKFDVKMTDTLRGVQIYFNPVGDIVHNKLFSLCYWSDVDVNANSENLVYKKINCKPYNIDSINGFATYLFDTLLIVPSGPMYIGMIQNDATMLGVGVDRNTVSTNNMFAFYTGYWYHSSVQGSWMIRPLFGDTIVNTPAVSINEPSQTPFDFSVYPNPASHAFFMDVQSAHTSDFKFQICNNLGEIIRSGKMAHGRTLISDLPIGFYFIRLTENKTGDSVTRKLVVEN